MYFRRFLGKYLAVTKIVSYFADVNKKQEMT